MKNTKRIKLAYDFLCLAERENRSFSLEEIVDKTGWALSTVKGYKSKKWHHFLTDEEAGYYKCNGVINLPLDSFIKIHEQRAEIHPSLYRPHFGNNVDILIDKSREATLLAIQIYNSPMTVFRTEGFIVNMIIAFTSLFHAIFERKKTEYWYVDDNGQPYIIDGDNKYWELSECLKNYYKETQTPEKENLVLCISIRNKIEHRFYDTMDLNLSGYCQSLLLNYENLLVTEFGNYFTIGNNHLALALQISSYDEAQKEALKEIQKQQYDEIRKYISDFCQNLPLEIVTSDKFCFRAFLIPKIGNHPNSSDVSIEWVSYDADRPDEMEKYNNVVGLIREKTIQVANQGKYLPGDVVALIKERGIEFSINLHTRAWKYYHIRSKEKSPKGCNTKYCQFSEPHKNYVYTNEWVEFLTKKLTDRSEYEKIKSYRD